MYGSLLCNAAGSSPYACITEVSTAMSCVYFVICFWSVPAVVDPVPLPDLDPPPPSPERISDA